MNTSYSVTVSIGGSKDQKEGFIAREGDQPTLTHIPVMMLPSGIRHFIISDWSELVVRKKLEAQKVHPTDDRDGVSHS